MKHTDVLVRDADPKEFERIGKLMVDVYSKLEGFPNADEQPGYYQTLARVGAFTANPGVRLLVAITAGGSIGGAVVYFGDMQYYGSGGSAPNERNAAGFRLLAVDPGTRGQGIGKTLSMACIDIARQAGLPQIIIHSTKSMQVAWAMYEKLGFKRSEDLDFNQGKLEVFGFRLFFG